MSTPVLTRHEARVLGVLVEKAHTTPAQYPLTLNALTTGSNQKSNRHPTLSLTDEQVFDAVDGLRQKLLSREVMMTGSRVTKYRHLARETLEVSTSELVVLTELMLRGPQTVGEIRGRASRMHPIESLDVANNLLDSLMRREPPLVQSFPPAPGSRAARFAQMLCREAPPASGPSAAAPTTAPTAAPPIAPAIAPPLAADPDALDDLAGRVERLELEITALKQAVERLDRG